MLGSWDDWWTYDGISGKMLQRNMYFQNKSYQIFEITGFHKNCRTIPLRQLLGGMMPPLWKQYHPFTLPRKAGMWECCLRLFCFASRMNDYHLRQSYSWEAYSVFLLKALISLKNDMTTNNVHSKWSLSQHLYMYMSVDEIDAYIFKALSPQMMTMITAHHSLMECAHRKREKSPFTLHPKTCLDRHWQFFICTQKHWWNFSIFFKKKQKKKELFWKSIFSRIIFNGWPRNFLSFFK